MTVPPRPADRACRGRIALVLILSCVLPLKRRPHLVIRPPLQIQLLTGSGHEYLLIFAPGGRNRAVYPFSFLVASRRDRWNCWKRQTTEAELSMALCESLLGT